MGGLPSGNTPIVLKYPFDCTIAALYQDCPVQNLHPSRKQRETDTPKECQHVFV